MNTDDLQDEWQKLYSAVRTVCLTHGSEDAFGHGDFWVVDDNWGSVAQKVIVSNPKFLTRGLVAELAACIESTKLFGAQIYVMLELREHPIAATMAMVIDSQGATEEWNLDAMRATLGPDFYPDS